MLLINNVNVPLDCTFSKKEVAKYAAGADGENEYFVSDSPVNFDTVARIFLGGDTVSAKKIDIEKY